MIIRNCQPADEAAVVALWRQVFAYPQARNDPAAVVRQKLAVQPGLFFVAEDGGAVVGTVMAGYDGHRGWLYRVAVHPRHRRRGVGRALVRHAEAALRALGCAKVNLQINADNADVAEFYRRLGYQVEERISMGKQLPGPDGGAPAAG